MKNEKQIEIIDKLVYYAATLERVIEERSDFKRDLSGYLLGLKRDIEDAEELIRHLKRLEDNTDSNVVALRILAKDFEFQGVKYGVTGDGCAGYLPCFPDIETARNRLRHFGVSVDMTQQISVLDPDI